MSLTLLEMCTEIMNGIGSQSVPTYLFTNEDDTAKQLLASAKKAGRELRDDYRWNELISTHTVTTVADTASYALPSDYSRFISDTDWNATDNKKGSGNTTPADWQAIINLPVTTSITHYWRIYGGYIWIKPTPSSVWSFTIEYLSEDYCESNGGTAQSIWTADDDTSRIPDRAFLLAIEYYYRKANGLPYSDAEAEYDNCLDSLLRGQRPSRSLNLAASVMQPGFLGDRTIYNIPDRVDS